MKEKQTQMWIPLYVDKWIFGSTRIELEPAERGVFIDLLAFGAKDEGYIRANETTPYHHTQLAGMLNIPIPLLQSTITKCIHFGKLLETAPGIYRIANWDKFSLSKDYKYRLESGKRDIPGAVRQNSDNSPKKAGPIIEETRREENTLSCASEFVKFWQAYPKKTGRAAALAAWEKAAPPLDKCLAALEWQTRSDNWQAEEGRFVPLPANWIEQARWMDIPDTHKLIVCPDCGHEGILRKGHGNNLKCGKCGGKNI